MSVITKEKLSIYLSRTPNCEASKVININNANAPIKLDIKGTEESTLYIKKNYGNPPAWTGLFTKSELVSVSDFGTSKMAGAVLLIKIKNQTYILSFGSGFHLINNEEVERDFGLRVTLNSVNPDKLRSLDKATFQNHNPLNSRNQSPNEVDIFQLHIDSDYELLYAVTGRSTIKGLGKQITGRDALSLLIETSLENLPNILKTAYSQYGKPLPKKFKWVDKISRVRDLDTIELLDLELDGVLLNKDSSNLWLGEPEIVNWEAQAYYSFTMADKADRFLALKINDLFEYLIKNNKYIDTHSLKNSYIHINDNNYNLFKKWTAYRCLYAEIIVGGEYYILKNGIWYKVDQDFEKEIDNYLVGLEVQDKVMPTYSHDREDEYNNYVCDLESNYELMDKKNIKIGGPYDKLEFCDLIKDDSEFVHVKFYRSSSTLSHLFSQGIVAAEAFVKDEKFREALNEKLPKSIKLSDTQKRPEPSEYKIIYAIATRKTIPVNLPFFSKVTLKTALMGLRALNYQVALSRIDIDENLLMKSKIKKKKKPKSL